MENNVVWTDKKRPIFGLPLSFTRYILTEEKLIINMGFFSKSEEEIRLYRITDFSVKQSFLQRIFGVGNIYISSSDNMQGEFTIYQIKKPYEIKNKLSDMVEIERQKKGIVTNEFLK